jgi:hypothetical protein
MSRTTAHYEDTDLAMFAMQLLDEEEHHATAEHVRDCAFCRQELSRLQGDLAACAYGVEMYAPPVSARERLMHQVAREKKAVAPMPVEEVRPVPPVSRMHVEEAEEESRPESNRPALEPDSEPRLDFSRRSVDKKSEPKPAHRRRRSEDSEEMDRPARRRGTLASGVFGWLGWALAAGFAVAGVRLYQQQMDYRTRLSVQAGELTELHADATGAKRLMEVMTDPSAQRILLSPPEADSGSMAEGHVIYEADKGSLILLADHLAPVGIDKIYELWMIPADGSNPVPAGTFRPDAGGHGSIILPSLPKAVPVKAFGITVEDGAGSQTPTMPIVLAGS